MKRHSTAKEEGQTIVLLALVVSMILLFAGFAIDGGYGLVQTRRAQNAADFASLAATKLMPCGVGAGSATGTQVQSTVQTVVDDNMTGNTSWTGQYLDSNGNPIAGATFSDGIPSSPPVNACGVSVQVNGTWNAFLTQLAGFKTISAHERAGAVGTGTQGYSLAIASLLPFARHTIFAGAVGQFTVNGSMYDNSVAQCNDRSDSCENYGSSGCLTGTPLDNITCYGDSADVFQQSSETITGTLYSVAPVAIDSCFYQAPSNGTAYPMTQSQYPQYFDANQCGSQFSSVTSPLNYGGIQGNVQPISDPLGQLPDPSVNGDVAAICPGQSSVNSHPGGVVASGNLNPGVYTSTVVIRGSVTFLPCQQSGTTSSPGIYIFQQGLEICPPPGNNTITGTNVMFYSEAAPPASASNTNTNRSGYCAAAAGPNGTVTDGITLGGRAGNTINLSAPTSGPYRGIMLYQDRNINLNIGLDDGWLHPGHSAFYPDGATVNITGVIYDNSYANEPAGDVFSAMGDSYQGPYSALCTGVTGVALAGNPTPCPGVPSGANISNSYGTVNVTGAVIVGGFGTQGGSNSNPLALTISFDASSVPQSVGGVRLVF